MLTSDQPRLDEMNRPRGTGQLLIGECAAANAPGRRR